MTESERIGILLFLYSRNELSVDEKTELSAWRLESPENEQLFLEVADKEFMRRALREYYQQRDEVFQTLKQRFPDLANAKLSSEPGFEDDDPIDQEYREFFPEKQVAESGLSKPEFWHSMIPECILSGERNDELEEEESSTINP